MKKNELDDLTLRVKEVIEYSNLTSGKFAEKTGIQNSTLAHILMGRNSPSIIVLQKIITAFPRISAEYLLMGTGQILKVKK